MAGRGAIGQQQDGEFCAAVRRWVGAFARYGGCGGRRGGSALLPAGTGPQAARPGGGQAPGRGTAARRAAA
jgi:hypothetical protein